MFDVGFVILQYKAIESTKRAVDSVLHKCDTENFAIIIVDNASPDGSGEKILNYYNSISNVYVLLNKANLGFSAGNNVGFSFAKYQLKCQYIILMNNDISIISSNFYEIMERDYAQYGYAVLGPKVYDKLSGDIRSNPVENANYSLKRLFIEKIDCQIYLMLRYLCLEEIWIKFRKTLSRLKNGYKKKKLMIFHEEKQLDIVLAGCIWIFSPKYVEKFEGLRTITFMYHEEEILLNQIKKYGMIMMYDPQLEVYHEHMSSTKMLGKSRKKSEILRYKIKLQSAKDLISSIKNEF